MANNHVIFKANLRSTDAITLMTVFCPSPCDVDFVLVPPVIPPERTCYMKATEVAVLFTELNEVVRATSCTVCCGWMAIVPVGVCCWILRGICLCRRTSQINDIIDKWNSTVLAGRHCHLELFATRFVGSHGEKCVSYDVRLVSDMPLPAFLTQQFAAPQCVLGVVVSGAPLYPYPPSHGTLQPQYMQVPSSPSPPSLAVQNSSPYALYAPLPQTAVQVQTTPTTTGGTSSSESFQHKVSRLVDMGFSQDAAAHALQANGQDELTALNSLLAGNVSY